MKWTSLLCAACVVSAAAADAQAADHLSYRPRVSRASTVAPLSWSWGLGAIPSSTVRQAPRLAQPGLPQPAESAIEPPIHDAAFYDHLGGAAQCGKGCKDDCCCPPVWAHRSGVFGEFLYLRPRDAELAYTVEVDSPVGATDVPVGPIDLADPDYSPGYRAGAVWAQDDCTSIVATYSRLETSTSHLRDINPPTALRALLLHPGIVNSGSNFLTASATHDVDFDLVDVDYRSVWRSCDLWAASYVVGVRYGRIEQDAQALYANSAGNPDQSLSTDIDFDGVGVHLGLDYERHACNTGWMVYGKAYASLLAGEFRATYFEGNTADPEIVDTSWRAGRIVPILDLELGGGWQSPCGHWRVTGGYMFSAWLNSLTTDEWIEAVHNNSFLSLDETVTFDGVTTRVEYRF